MGEESYDYALINFKDLGGSCIIKRIIIVIRIIFVCKYFMLEIFV